MSARSSLLAVVLGLTMLGAPAAAEAHAPPGTPIYLNRSYSFEERAADLVSRMTLAEKASQMVSSQAPAIPRLGIPAYGWWNEALHGVSRLQTAPSGNATTLFSTTSYPIDLSLGASWDPDLMYREASAISDEAREVVPNNSLDLDFYHPPSTSRATRAGGATTRPSARTRCSPPRSPGSSSTAWRARTATATCCPQAAAT